MTQPSTSRRPVWGTGAVAVALVVASSCGGASSSGSSMAAQAPTPIAPATTAAMPAVSTDSTAGSSPATTVAPVDGARALHAGLDALSATYHFVSTVTVDGAVVLVAEGDRVGDGSRLTLTGSKGAISYVITPQASWAMPEGGVWQQLDSDPADVDTIAALRSSAAARVDAVDADAVRLTVTVPPASLGIAGDGAADLAVRIVGGVVRSISYSSTAQGKPASVVSNFGPARDPSPVTAPI